MSKKKQEDPVVEPEEQLTEDTPATETAHEADTAPMENDADDQLAELNNRLLRMAAEFENYKKRTQREKLQLMETAGRKTMLALLPVLDDFDRAKQAAAQQNEEKQAEFAGGIGLIIKKLYDSLHTQGLKVMESTGEDFDADRHEAITEIPNPDMAGKVVDTVEKGYTLNGNIIRYAKVVVGK
ncbi:MAG: nucleotide exchange factor GrpE [Bacteroidota bacterium]